MILELRSISENSVTELAEKEGVRTISRQVVKLKDLAKDITSMN